MKALVYTDTNSVTYRDEPDPAPRAGEALVEIDAVGICGSDMHAYHGHDARRVPPMILGHEACGLVRGGTLDGRRAAINPLITCGRCDHCQGGRSNLCQSRELVGMRLPGAFAERIAVPEQNLLPIPEDMDPVRAALTEPAATAVHSLALAEQALYRPLSEAAALVLGGGSIGLLSALLLQGKGCQGVALADTNPLRRATAERAGIARVLDPLSPRPYDPDAFDLVIDAVGGGATRRAASEAVRPGGVISHIGLMDGEPGLDVRKLTLSEVAFIGNYTYTPIDLRASIDALHSGALGDLDWVEERPLAEGAAAFDDLDRGRTAAAKVVLRPG